MISRLFRRLIWRRRPFDLSSSPPLLSAPRSFALCFQGRDSVTIKSHSLSTPSRVCLLTEALIKCRREARETDRFTCLSRCSYAPLCFQPFHPLSFSLSLSLSLSLSISRFSTASRSRGRGKVCGMKIDAICGREQGRIKDRQALRIKANTHTHTHTHTHTMGGWSKKSEPVTGRDGA